jgi:O-antigen/teichoic acid export membrane protein
MRAATAPAPAPTRSFASSVATTYGANIGAAALALANVIITARALGPAGRGDVVFLTTIAMLTATLATLGIEEANGNLAGVAPATRRALASNSAILALVLGGTAVAVLFALFTAFPGMAGDSTPELRWLAAAAIPILILQIALQFLIRADYGFALTNVATLAAPVLTVTVNGVLALTGRITVGAALAVWVGAQLVSTTLLVAYVARRLQGFGRPNLRLALGALGFGVKAHTGRVMKTGNYRLDQWLLGSMAGSKELGLYSVAVAWSEALFYLPEAVGMVLRPDLVRASRSDAARRAATAFRIAVLLTVPVVLGLIVAAPILCITVFGDSFAGSVDDLRVLAPGAFGMVALKLLANALTAQGKPMLGNAAVAVAFLTTIALDLLLIPSHGGLGAAVASTAAYTAGGLAVAIIFARTLRARMGDLVPRGRDVSQLAARLRSGAA